MQASEALADVIESSPVCRVEECETAVHARGLCRMHYHRSRAGIDLDLPKYGMTPWGSVIEWAMELADAPDPKAYHHALDKFRTAIDRLIACGPDEVKHGWRKKVAPAAATRRVCSVAGCGRKRCARGLCRSHYWMQKRGEPLRPIRARHVSTSKQVKEAA